MKRKFYRTIDDVLSSPWASLTQRTEEKPQLTDRILRSTKLEDAIYSELRAGDDELSRIESSARQRLPSFPALSRDIYQSFYSLMPRRNDESVMSPAAKKFNSTILDHVIQSEDYPTLKTLCEGSELPAYEAASEFISRTAEDLEKLLLKTAGDYGTLNTLKKLEDAKEQAQDELLSLLERVRQSAKPNDTLNEAVISAANEAENKRRQAEAVSKHFDILSTQNKDFISARVSGAMSSARERAEEVQSILGAWSDEPGNFEKSQVNSELLAAVRKSDVLRDISKYLGRFREIFAEGKRNGYTYGRGEKYSLELGRDLSRALASEFAMLASPQTTPLFLRKYQRGQIKQYQRREPVYKGKGDIICCLDESGSTKGDPAAWGKAVALTLLEIVADGGRSFALIHFSGGGSFKTDIFRPGGYTPVDKLASAETFLGGGTDFLTPMHEALRLMDEDGFENADVVFITDGECEMPESFTGRLAKRQAERRFTVTGVLLDKGSPGMDFSLKSFCQNIYRTSELLGEDIVKELVTQRV